MENDFDIVQLYFSEQQKCNSLLCQKVIFEPSTKREWFFEEEVWCYFEFYCDDDDYALRKQEDKTFSNDCVVRNMSYEILMLLAYVRLRGVVTIEKSLFNSYVNRYEQAKFLNPDLTPEKFNYELKEKEEEALIHSDKITNGILGGCLLLIAAVALLFLFAIFAYFKKLFL